MSRHDLTTLQREANRYYGFYRQSDLKIVQELYEEKLVTYPRTDSQYITEDMQQTMQICSNTMAAKQME